MEKRKAGKKYYRVDCFIRVEEEEPQVYDYLEDAQEDHDQLEMMHKENYYEVNECDEKGQDLG